MLDIFGRKEVTLSRFIYGCADDNSKGVAVPRYDQLRVFAMLLQVDFGLIVG